MLATVVELWRYPVKSLLGEVLDEVTLEQRGVVGDRLHAVTDRNGKLGSGKTTTASDGWTGSSSCARGSSDEQTLVTLPDGRELAAGDPVLDAFLSDRYQDELRVARESAVVPSRRASTASAHDLFGGMARDPTPRFTDRPAPISPEHAPGRRRRRARRGRLGGSPVRSRRRCHPRRRPNRPLRHDDESAVRTAEGSLCPARVTELNDACLGVFAIVEQAGVVRVGDRLSEIS